MSLVAAAASARPAAGRSDVADMIVAALPPDIARFAELFLRQVAEGDLADHAHEQVAANIVSMWEFSAERPPGVAKARWQPSAPTNRRAGAMLEIVNDDMPFLVDSVSALLGQRGVTIDLIIHPVIATLRDAHGRRLALDQGPAESVMQILLTEPVDAATAAALMDQLHQTLHEIRIAVADWAAMSERLTEAAALFPTAGDLAETRAFIRWISDRFILLGYREYRFEEHAGRLRLEVVEGSGLGILSDPEIVVFDHGRDLAAMPGDMRALIQEPTPLLLAKSRNLSRVHRAVPMDVIGVKEVGPGGRIQRERRFVGLFTSTVYRENPRAIPLVRRKIDTVIEQAGFDPASHDGKALVAILVSYPLDELLSITAAELGAAALGILQLQERRRIALFTRVDPFEGFVSCLIYVPQDRYSFALKTQFEAMLAAAFAGTVMTSVVDFPDSPLARLYLVVRTARGLAAAVDVAALETRLIEAGRSWTERLQAAAPSADAADRVRWLGAKFPTAYIERFTPAEALIDLDRLAATTPDAPCVALSERPGAIDAPLTVKLYRPHRPAPLSDVLPLIEHHGLRVETEDAFCVQARGGAFWVQQFGVSVVESGLAEPVARLRARFEDSLMACWRGAAEDDAFNRLVLSAGLSWRETMVLRAYAKYLRQIGFALSQGYIAAALAKHPAITALVMQLFHARFDPARAEARTAAIGLAVEIDHALDEVSALDEDRILRRYVNLVRSTVRTNFYQTGADGGAKPYLSLKFDSRMLDDLPKPRPLVEIWVYAPEVEAIHLRGGRVARGGIRWSDRREDFRTEVLGLMKAQNVKNAVIVPIGSKGGFVLKPASAAGALSRVAPPGAPPPAIAGYGVMMRGLLDLTDNRRDEAVVPPPQTVRHDGDDPYLVVAADKGTASFSDIANGIAQDYGFWLDDAFASGGSAGYDHKALAITARGAWVAVERHLREAGVDPARDVIRLVGVGDMSGDVFGNGLLHSERLKLIAAFNHQHIFVDPDPDPTASFAERRRLFALPRSSWADYDAALLSPGGGVFERAAKSLKLSPEMKAALAIERDVLTPAELIQAILRAEVDLMWLGGIGNYIKARGESHAEAGDRANDAVRIDAPAVRARIIGEGANLGVTQRGRIEYAARGGRINTDAIDNSAGVDCSDHEVNLKILFSEPLARGAVTRAERDAILAGLADQVCARVLRDNYLQALALSLAIQDGPAQTARAGRLMRTLERDAALDRELEALPSDAELAARAAAGGGLFRPELAVLIAFEKIALDDALLDGDLLDDPALERDLFGYFPPALHGRFAGEIRRHGLRREIVATALANEMVNRLGIGALLDLAEATGATAAALARGFVAARDLLEMRAVWLSIEALDSAVAPADQLRLFSRAARALAAAMRWFSRAAADQPLDAIRLRFAEPIARLRTIVAPNEPRGDAARGGVSGDVAMRVATLEAVAAALPALDLSERAGLSFDQAVGAFAAAAERFHLDLLYRALSQLPQVNDATRAAAAALADDFAQHQLRLAERLLTAAPRSDPHAVGARARLDAMIAELRGGVDLARLTLAEHLLRAV